KVGAVSRLGIPFCCPASSPIRKMSFHHLIIRSWKRTSANILSTAASYVAFWFFDFESAWTSASEGSTPFSLRDAVRSASPYAVPRPAGALGVEPERVLLSPPPPPPLLVVPPPSAT